MSFVVEDEDVLLSAKFSADTAHHLRWRLAESAGLIAMKDLLVKLAGLGCLPQKKGVKVCDENLCPRQFFPKVRRSDIPDAVVVVGIVGQKDSQAVPDRDTGRHHQKRVREARILRLRELIESLPGNQHGHDNGFPRAGRHFECNAGQSRVGGVIGCAKIVFHPGVTVFLGDFGEVNRGFEGLDLAEEELVFPLGVRPVFQETACCRGDAGVIPLSPHAHTMPNAVDQLAVLLPVLGPLRVDLELFPALSRAGYGDKVGAEPPAFDDLVGDPVFRELEVSAWFLEGRVQDRIFDNFVRHGGQ